MEWAFWSVQQQVVGSKVEGTKAHFFLLLVAYKYQNRADEGQSETEVCVEETLTHFTLQRGCRGVW
jgi:hypothetical protein